jgi:hypothetical protein
MAEFPAGLALFDAHSQRPPALACLFAFGIATNLQRQIDILDLHEAKIYAVAGRLGAKGGLSLQLQLRGSLRRKRLALPALEHRQELKLPAFRAALALVHKKPSFADEFASLWIFNGRFCCLSFYNEPKKSEFSNANQYMHAVVLVNNLNWH